MWITILVQCFPRICHISSRYNLHWQSSYTEYQQSMFFLFYHEPILLPPLMYLAPIQSPFQQTRRVGIKQVTTVLHNWKDWMGFMDWIVSLLDSELITIWLRFGEVSLDFWVYEHNSHGSCKWSVSCTHSQMFLKNVFKLHVMQSMQGVPMQTSKKHLHIIFAPCSLLNICSNEDIQYWWRPMCQTLSGEMTK